MVLVCVCCRGESARRGRWIDQDVVVALDEGVPFVQRVNALSRLDHVAIEVLLLVCLGANGLVELTHALLERPDDVGFELAKVLLYSEQVVAAAILLANLLAEAVVYAALNNVWIVHGVEFG